MLNSSTSRGTWLFWILALLVLGAGLGLRDPWPADEPRFALVAKEMVESGQWLFPHRGTELYSDKPPMLMWLQAASFTVIGNWRIAFLLPSLLAALGTLWCVIDLGTRLWTRKVGHYAGWALLFTLQFVYQAKKAQIDPLETFWITLANYGLLRHFLTTRSDPGANWWMWTLGWFAAGLGTITKGVGVLALLMLVPALIASTYGWRNARVPIRTPYVLLGPFAFIAATALWLVPMLTSVFSRSDPAYRVYLNDILFNQTAHRYLKSWDHPQPALYYLGMMLILWLPPLLALPWALPAWKRRLKRRDARYLLPLMWWALIVLFFSFPSGKRDVYIMPALPMVCLALAPLLPGIVRKLWAQRLTFLFGTGLALGMLAIGVGTLWASPSVRRPFIVDSALSLPRAHARAWLLIAISMWGLGCMLWFGRRRSPQGVMSMLAGLWVLYGLIAYPMLTDSSSARGLMLQVGREIGPTAELGMVAWKEQNLLMADRPATTFGFVTPPAEQFQSALAWQAKSPQRRWLLAEASALPTCVDRTRAKMMGVSIHREWWLLKFDAVTACPSHHGIRSKVAD